MESVQQTSVLQNNNRQNDSLNMEGVQQVSAMPNNGQDDSQTKAMKTPTEEEQEMIDQTCSRCEQRGHVSKDCDVPLLYITDGTRRQKIQRCTICRAVGHNRRTCLNYLALRNLRSRTYQDFYC